MEDCLKCIKKLNNLIEHRPDPDDMLYNIAESVNGVDLTEEGWSNFYNYITEQDPDNWHYKQQSDVMTMGDIPENDLQLMANELNDEYEKSLKVQDYKVTHNGMETIIEITNKLNSICIKK